MGGKPGKSGYIIPESNPLIEIIHYLAYLMMGILYPSPSRYIIPEIEQKQNSHIGILYPIVSRYIIPDLRHCFNKDMGILYPFYDIASIKTWVYYTQCV